MQPVNPNLVLIVGKEFSSLTDHLTAAGYDYIILRDRDETILTRSSGNKILCDFSTRETTLAALKTIDRPVAAVMTLYENYVLPTAWINEELGLPGMSVDSALACTDKLLMRTAFTNAPEPISPDFTFVDSEADLRAFAADHQFPLILKPANLVKSLLVTRSDSLDELLANYTHTMERITEVYDQYAPNRQPRILVEEFLEGSLHSVAAFADTAGQPHIIESIVDLQTAHSRGFDDNFLYSRTLPTNLTPEQQASLYRCAAMGIQALGMRSTPAHVEIILTTKGPRIVEIGARNGGYRERMYRLANGIDIVQATVDIAIGTTPNLEPAFSEYCTVIELFPATSGAFSDISHAEEIANLPSCAYYACKINPGEPAGPAADGFKRCGIVVLHSADKEQYEKDLAFINDQVRVNVR